MSTALPVLRPDLDPPRAPHAPAHARQPGHLLDSHGRQIQDVRLSITDRCNFRCVYCMEPGDRFLPKMELLNLGEYLRLVDVLLELGIRTLRLTGGEPTLYPQLDELIEGIGQRDLDDVAMTTNGSQLDPERLAHWRAHGLRRLTFSLDTLREDRMASITRSRTTVAHVLEAIEQARNAGFPRPKVNAVIIRGVNDDEVADFAELARRRDLDVRFIEFMPLDSSRAWNRDHVVDADEMLASIQQRFDLQADAHTGPHSTSMNWTFADDAPGRIGMIAPVSRPFCGPHPHTPATDFASPPRDEFAPASSATRNGISVPCFGMIRTMPRSPRPSSTWRGPSRPATGSTSLTSSSQRGPCRPSADDQSVQFQLAMTISRSLTFTMPSPLTSSLQPPGSIEQSVFQAAITDSRSATLVVPSPLVSPGQPGGVIWKTADPGLPAAAWTPTRRCTRRWCRRRDRSPCRSSHPSGHRPPRDFRPRSPGCPSSQGGRWRCTAGDAHTRVRIRLALPEGKPDVTVDVHRHRGVEPILRPGQIDGSGLDERRLLPAPGQTRPASHRYRGGTSGTSLSLPDSTAWAKTNCPSRQ